MTQSVKEQFAIPDLPFSSKVSLKPLLKAWHTQGDSHPLLQQISDKVIALEQSQPELFQAYDDIADLRAQQTAAEIQLLLTPIMSFTDNQHNLAAIARPYYYEFIYATPMFQQVLLDQKGHLNAQPVMNLEWFSFGRDLHAYTTIAQHCYGLEFKFEKHPIFVTKDTETGLKRYFQFLYDAQYLEVKAKSHVKKPSDQQIETLRQNMLDLDLWRDVFPAQDYEIQGIIIVCANDITEREVVSKMQEALTNGTMLVSPEGMRRFNDGVCDLLGRSDIRVRLLSKQADKIFMIEPDCSGYTGCLISNSRHLRYEDLKNSIYAEVKKSGRGFLSVKDVTELDTSVPIHQMLQDENIGSMLLLPLYDEGQPLGVLQLDFSERGKDHSDIALRSCDMAAIATLGLKHSKQMLDEGVQGMIQRKSSVVHEAVEWRFREAALNAILGNKGDNMEEIVFRDVYPLFSQTDIKDSSNHRNRAIEADLRAQLISGQKILQLAQEKQAMPLLEEINFRIDRFLQGLDDGLKSGDEVTIQQFFRHELEPALQQLTLLGEEVEQAVADYQDQLDPHYHSIHKERKEYEQSVLQLNEAIAKFLDQEQPQVQKILPHYFEKTCTDGVEMMMYLGASMVEDGHFDPFYLRNMRLWQLRITCQIAKLCEQMKAKLTIPFDTTHLILVQDTPMSIRFSETERNFIVDGAYNIRYEIMKKRIDKALINGSSERLTQPGKIAIVYSHNKEAQEYRRYIEFLQHQGFLQDKVEDLTLEALQGLQGLRALRVTVNVAHQTQSEVVTELFEQPELAAAI